MKIKSNSKLKTAVLTSILALTVASPAFAYDSASLINHDKNSNFRVYISGEGSANNEGSRTECYLYWCANDTVVRHDNDSVTLKGGNWYIQTVTEHDVSYNKDYTYDFLGSSGMSEDELKQAIDDAIHNVQGDQTVNGSQDITGDQTVEGEQTVNGGQTVTGGFYFFNNKV